MIRTHKEQNDATANYIVRRVATMHPAKPHTICGVHGGWTWSILLIPALLFGVPCVRAQSTVSEPLAEVNGEMITSRGTRSRALGARLSQLEEQIYNLKRRELDCPNRATPFSPGGGKAGDFGTDVVGRGGNGESWVGHRKGDRRLLSSEQGADTRRRSRHTAENSCLPSTTEVSRPAGVLCRIVALAG